MVKKSKVTTTKTSTPKILPHLHLGGNDVIGMKPAVKGVNNNYLYGGLLVVLAGAGYLFTNPMLLGRLLGRSPPPPVSVTAPPMVQPGAAVPIQGMFNPPVPAAWYVVTNAQGQQVASGSLGNNVSQFSTQIPATNLPNGSYTVTVTSDGPPGGVGPTGTIGPQGPGTVYPTAGSLQQGLQNNQLGAATSGPESISLS